MSRYIDIGFILNETDEFGYENGVLYGLSGNSAPSIDIVRCGECMHNGSYDTDCPFGWKNREWNMPKPCDFCSYGEREGE